MQDKEMRRDSRNNAPRLANPGDSAESKRGEPSTLRRLHRRTSLPTGSLVGRVRTGFGYGEVDLLALAEPSHCVQPCAMAHLRALGSRASCVRRYLRQVEHQAQVEPIDHRFNAPNSCRDECELVVR